MPRMRLYFLGPPRVEIDDQQILFPRRKSVALLAYVALSGDTQTRDKLATLFWPESSQSRARGALRRELSSMRTVLGGDWLVADAESVSLHPRDEIWLDVRAFEDGTKFGNGEIIDLERMTSAVAHYRDDFLAGFTLANSPAFDEWQFFHAETLRQTFAASLEMLIQVLSDRRDEENAIRYARRRLALDPLHEPAHCCLMRLYAQSGQWAAALRQYQICCQTLHDELGVPPAPETTTLFEQIRTRRLRPDEPHSTAGIAVEERSQPDIQSPRQILLAAPRPAFLDDEAEDTEIERRVFVERTRELAQLDEFLAGAVGGHGRVVFITGGAGRGKTSLIQEFVSRAQSMYSDLLAAGGSCSMVAGVGVPYLPFRDVMEMLSGAVETKWTAGAITSEHARRIWHLFPEIAETLAEIGPDLIEVLVNGEALVSRVSAAVPDDPAWTARLRVLAEHREARSAELDQGVVFEQVVRVLQRLANGHPLVLTIDDLQWADNASIALLFHLGRRIEGSRILVIGAYRAEEIIQHRGDGQHPLHKVIHEFKRTFGDIEIDLSHATQAEGRRFVDVLLDTEPNNLGEEFRHALHRKTAGHPLFTVEILRAMQDRGDLVLDQESHWVEGSALDWEILPARIEGVIEERIGRLEPEQLEFLKIASVEGESFTLEAVAQVQGVDRRSPLFSTLYELQSRYRLVREQEETAVGGRLLSRHRFIHVLFQNYLYNSLGAGERRYLHFEIGRALETLYAEHTDEIAAQLAHHFRQADFPVKTVKYARQAARRAIEVSAFEDAMQHLQSALDLLDGDEHIEMRAEVLEELGDANSYLPRKYQTISLYQTALEERSRLVSADEAAVLRLHRKIVESTVGSLWLIDSEEFETLPDTVTASRSYLEDSLASADHELPTSEQVRFLTALASLPSLGDRLPLDIDSTEKHAQAAVALAEQLDSPIELADALEALNNINFVRGRIRDRLMVSRRRLALAQDPRFSDTHRKISIVSSMGDSLMLAGQYDLAISYYEQAEEQAHQLRSPSPENAAIGRQALCWYRLDRWDQVLKQDEKRRDLEQHYPLQWIPARCLIVAIVAAVRASRGEAELARALREQANDLMVRSAAGSSENWGRTQHY